MQMHRAGPICPFVQLRELNLSELNFNFSFQTRYEYVVMVMLPQIEHSLRRLYASVNQMPERVQTAESAEFYTTFNEVNMGIFTCHDAD